MPLSQRRRQLCKKHTWLNRRCKILWKQAPTQTSFESSKIDVVPYQLIRAMKELEILEQTLETQLMMVRMGIMYNGFYRNQEVSLLKRTRETKESRKVVAC